jgi:hypothetical protein
VRYSRRLSLSPAPGGLGVAIPIRALPGLRGSGLSERRRDSQSWPPVCAASLGGWRRTSWAGHWMFQCHLGDMRCVGVPRLCSLGPPWVLHPSARFDLGASSVSDALRTSRKLSVDGSQIALSQYLAGLTVRHTPTALDQGQADIEAGGVLTSIHQTFASQIVLMPVPARYPNVGS